MCVCVGAQDATSEEEVLHSMSSSEDDEDTASLASSVAELSQGTGPSFYSIHARGSF